MPIKNVQISYDEPWIDHHIKTITSAYNSAPYFDYYGSAVFDLIDKKFDTLYELNIAILDYLIGLEIIEKYAFTTSYVVSPDSTIIDKRPSSAMWDKHIEPYIQVFEDKYGFSNNLSILDALFNLGPETRLMLKH